MGTPAWEGAPIIPFVVALVHRSTTPKSWHRGSGQQLQCAQHSNPVLLLRSPDAIDPTAKRFGSEYPFWRPIEHRL